MAVGDLTHRNLVANTMQMMQMLGSHIRPGKEVVLTALPMYHIFAFTVNLVGFFQKGARNILVPSPRPPANLRTAFERFPITWTTGVNTLFNALLNEPWFRDSPPPHLVASAAGGMALHESVAREWRRVTGTPIVEGYGLTETSPCLTFNPLGGRGRTAPSGSPCRRPTCDASMRQAPMSRSASRASSSRADRRSCLATGIDPRRPRTR